jgi:sRNA-binding protein
MNESITITKAQLRAALQQWEQDHRDGKCMSSEEAAALSVEEHAALGADALWESLSAAVTA